MATYPSTLRRGLPRERGGDAWPPQGDAPADVVSARAETLAGTAVAAASGPIVEMADAPAAAAPVPPPSAEVNAAPSGPTRSMRRGLPRVPGGEPWPVSAAAPAAAPAAPTPPAAATLTGAATPTPAPATAPAAAAAAPAAMAPVAPAPGATTSDRPLRRGLPRVKGAEPWPPAGFAPALAVVAEIAPAAEEMPATPEVVEPAAAAASVAAVPAAPPVRTPLAAATARPVPPAQRRPAPAPAGKPGRFGDYTPGQLIGSAVIGGFGLLLAATFAVVVAGWFVGLDFMQDFLATYPGETSCPRGHLWGCPHGSAGSTSSMSS